MKLRHIILSAAVILGFAACNDEDALTPNPDTAGVTYEFPEGNNAWDQDLQEIANEFGVKCIYKNLTLEDLTRSWTAAGSGTIQGYHGSGLVNDRQAQLYTKFFKDNVFAFLNPDVVQNTLPAYFFFAHDYCSINHRLLTETPIENDTLEWCGRPRVEYEGMGFWVFSYSSEEHNDIMGRTWQQYMFTSADSVRMMREMVLKNIFNILIEDDIIDTPLAFEVGGGLDYSTPITYGSTNINDENYYKRRGFPEQLNNLVSYGNPQDLYSISSTNPTDNFFDYICLGLRYSREEILENYADFPLCIQYYNITVEHLQTNYGMDLTLMSAAAEPLE